MRQATLCLLLEEDKNSKKILLAMKKRGFGAGKWNGVGGKFDEAKDKNIFDTAVRETKEEIGVNIKNPERVAILNFHFPYKKEWDQSVHVFFARNWDKDPQETEEMAPKWFRINEIPFDKMWDDDHYWLSDVLAGKKIKADFIFKEGEIIDKRNIFFVEKI